MVGNSLAKAPSTTDLINRARATLGTEKALNGVVTLKMVGSLEPVDPKVPAATVLIIARKPQSQRLEIRVDDMVETTILNCRKSCIIRSNLKEDASQMRELTGPELERVRHSTRQFFNFYRPDFKNGERVSYEGIVTHRDKRAHKVKYTYPEGLETIRYFSVEDDTLVATITENDVESVNRGAQVVKGIKYPESIDYYEDGRKLHTIKWSEVEVNEPLAAGVFKVPQASEK
ncbi:hypothetical protein DDZ13_05920 [Coraliomargarita sinensis]|uniref:Outer membrane lipoprotein-sorting protein n=2 Tax=Coraliomargarita sinensis TaxID=2174842 RepID=A0A317ZGL0_9BACT|nr:hypothetical protein DDZ13_05920 [Coraliomargarita sinensis]